MDAALLWLRSEDKGEPVFVVGRSRVKGDFPTAFTLEVLEPPPAGNGSLFDPQFPYGVIAAIPAGSSDRVDPYALLGIADNAGVIYFPEDGQRPDDEISRVASGFKVPPRKGFHLWRSEITEEQEAEFFRCHYDGVCEHVLFSPEIPGLSDPVVLAVNQSRNDEDYARCLKYLPDAERCVFDYRDPNSPAPEGCIELLAARDARRAAREEQGLYCWARHRIENPQGFDYPVTVTLGRTIYDVYEPRYHE